MRTQLRAALYPAAGLTARGQPANCSRAGKVLLQAASGPGYSLRVWHAGQPTPLQLTLPFDTSRCARTHGSGMHGSGTGSHA